MEEVEATQRQRGENEQQLSPSEQRPLDSEHIAASHRTKRRPCRRTASSRRQKLDRETVEANPIPKSNSSIVPLNADDR